MHMRQCLLKKSSFVRSGSATGTQIGGTLALLSKAQLRENLIESLWKSDFVDQQVKGALDSLFGPEPDPQFVRFVRNRLPKLTPSEVKESLSRLRISLDFPAVNPLRLSLGESDWAAQVHIRQILPAALNRRQAKEPYGAP